MEVHDDLPAGRDDDRHALPSVCARVVRCKPLFSAFVTTFLFCMCLYCQKRANMGSCSFLQSGTVKGQNLFSRTISVKSPCNALQACRVMSVVGVPMYITETGVADLDDTRREQMFDTYFAQVCCFNFSDQPY